jgi:hypothetical protein
MPSPASAPVEDALTKLLKNPLVLAGGAMLAGMALTRLFSTSPMRKLARDLAEEALNLARSADTTEAAVPASLLEKGLEALRPQLMEAVTGLLSSTLKKSKPSE